MLRNRRLSQEAEDRVRVLVETSPPAILTVNEGGLIELANHAAEELLLPTVELINSGHLPPLILRSGTAMPLAATGVPLGLFHASTYGLTGIQLALCETLLLYTNGITKARNPSGVEYGRERLVSFVAERSHLPPEELVRACVDDVTAFTADTELSDDRTLLALRRA